MKTKYILATLVLALPLTAMADPKPGTETRAWTDLQKSGKSSSKESRPMPGEVAGKVYDRYAKSFDHSIPETYSRESFVGGGGGSGSGSSGGSGSGSSN